jgi:hypothetical protein
VADNERDEFLNRERLCPSCRSTINILAVKCKFCGQDIGKPKEELRELSSEDLGGESILHSAPSGMVMSAIEAFRAENLESGGSDPRSDSNGGSRADVPQAPGEVGADGLPILNATSQGLNSLSDSTFSARATVSKPPTTFKDRAVPIGLTIVGLVVIVFAGIKGTSAVMDYLDAKNRVVEPDFINRYYEILASNGSVLQALEAAKEALDANNSGPNQEIATKALVAIEKEVLDLLNTVDWSMTTIIKAARMGESAARVYAHALTGDLRKKTKEENRLYSMTLKSIAPDGKSATFTLLNGDTLENVRKGDVVESRFNVVHISPISVILEDRLRKSRAGAAREVSFNLKSRTAH